MKDLYHDRPWKTRSWRVTPNQRHAVLAKWRACSEGLWWDSLPSFLVLLAAYLYFSSHVVLFKYLFDDLQGGI